MSTVLKHGGYDEEAMQAYFREGEKRALALGNRGPIRLGPDGRLHADIIETYQRVGFYIFEGVLDTGELDELRAEFMALFDRMPACRGATLDHAGRPALAADFDTELVRWSKPLGDPTGGSTIAKGRAPVKMDVPEPPKDAPDEIPFSLLGPLQFSDAAFRVYGHPGLLAVAEAVNGADFTPYNEAFIIKKPGEGIAFAWHQDGTTHWDTEDWTPISHGFNFMVQMFDCTAANGMWYVPGTHALGRLDIREVVDAAGGIRLPGAVPIICKAGDVAMSNRQILHGSFANNSPDWRVTLNLGFHRRQSVLGIETEGLFGGFNHYDAAWIDKRCDVIGYAIDARRQRFPNERAYTYRPHAGRRLVWDEAARKAIRDYQKLDLFI